MRPDQSRVVQHIGTPARHWRLTLAKMGACFSNAGLVAQTLRWIFFYASNSE